jgi:hypothetical protein
MATISPLRRRMIEDRTIRNLSRSWAMTCTPQWLRTLWLDRPRRSRPT